MLWVDLKKEGQPLAKGMEGDSHVVLGRLVKCSRTDLANACSVAAEVAWRTRRVVRRVSKGRGGNMEVVLEFFGFRINFARKNKFSLQQYS